MHKESGQTNGCLVSEIARVMARLVDQSGEVEGASAETRATRLEQLTRSVLAADAGSLGGAALQAAVIGYELDDIVSELEEEGSPHIAGLARLCQVAAGSIFAVLRPLVADNSASAVIERFSPSEHTHG